MPPALHVFLYLQWQSLSQLIFSKNNWINLICNQDLHPAVCNTLPVLLNSDWLHLFFSFHRNAFTLYYIYIYIYAFSRRFYPKRLTLHSSDSFYILSALAFPGNRTHDLGVANAMLYQLSYRKAGTNWGRGEEWQKVQGNRKHRRGGDGKMTISYHQHAWSSLLCPALQQSRGLWYGWKKEKQNDHVTNLAQIL